MALDETVELPWGAGGAASGRIDSTRGGAGGSLSYIA